MMTSDAAFDALVSHIRNVLARPGPMTTVPLADLGQPEGVDNPVQYWIQRFLAAGFLARSLPPAKPHDPVRRLLVSLSHDRLITTTHDMRTTPGWVEVTLASGQRAYRDPEGWYHAVPPGKPPLFETLDPDDIYTQIARVTGVDREAVKRVTHAWGYTSSDNSPSDVLAQRTQLVTMSVYLRHGLLLIATMRGSPAVRRLARELAETANKWLSDMGLAALADDIASRTDLSDGDSSADPAPGGVANSIVASLSRLMEDIGRPPPGEDNGPRSGSGVPSEYLGDGVVASFDGYHVWLSAGDMRVALEPEVYTSLVSYVNQIRARGAWGGQA